MVGLRPPACDGTNVALICTSSSSASRRTFSSASKRSRDFSSASALAFALASSWALCSAAACSLSSASARASSSASCRSRSRDRSSACCRQREVAYASRSGICTLVAPFSSLKVFSSESAVANAYVKGRPSPLNSTTIPTSVIWSAAFFLYSNLPTCPTAPWRSLLFTSLRQSTRAPRRKPSFGGAALSARTA